ncbi:MAG: DUF1667 domain-containing protein, partial [bacterium]|nr:DUF1667 domain-containing protein [bacterium]
TTTVKTSHPVYRRLPVRLSCEIPLEQIKIFMNAINQVSINNGCKPGDLVAENLLESGVDLVATGGVCFEEG